MSPARWVFGYGSLLWRPEFLYEEAAPAWLEGYARRFWQKSPDHRGTPDAPGRVVTLVESPASRVWGVAFRVAREQADEVFARLDYREKEGYERVEVELHPVDAARETIRGVVYIAGARNPYFTGDAPLEAIAERVVRAKGPSGANREYVIELARVLRDNGVDEPHVFALERLVRDSAPGSTPL